MKTYPMYDESREVFGCRVGTFRSMRLYDATTYAQRWVRDAERSIFERVVYSIDQRKHNPLIDLDRMQAWVGIETPHIRGISDVSFEVRNTQEGVKKSPVARSALAKYLQPIPPVERQHVCVTLMRTWTAASSLQERHRQGEVWDVNTCVRVGLDLIDAIRALRALLDAQHALHPVLWGKPNTVGLRADGRVVLMYWAGLEDRAARDFSPKISVSLWCAPESADIHDGEGLCVREGWRAGHFEALDVYSVGILVYWMMVGKHPVEFQGDRAERGFLFPQAPIYPWDSVRMHRATCPETLSAVIARAVHFSPQERWATLDAFAVALQDALPDWDDERARWGLDENDPIAYVRTLLYANDEDALLDWVFEVRSMYGDDAVLWEYLWEVTWGAIRASWEACTPLRMRDVYLCIACSMHSRQALLEVMLNQDSPAYCAVDACSVLSLIDEESLLGVLRTRWSSLSPPLRTWLLSSTTRLASYAAYAQECNAVPEHEESVVYASVVWLWEAGYANEEETKARSVACRLPLGEVLFFGRKEYLVAGSFERREVPWLGVECLAEETARFFWVEDDQECEVILHSKAHCIAQIGHLIVLPDPRGRGFVCGDTSRVLPYASDVRNWSTLEIGGDSREVGGGFDPYEDDLEEDSIVVDWGEVPSPEEASPRETCVVNLGTHGEGEGEDDTPETKSEGVFEKFRAWWKGRS